MIREIISAAIVCCGLTSTMVLAQDWTNERCAHPSAILESAEGLVQYQLSHSSEWINANRGDTFCYGESLRVVEFRAAIRLDNDTLVRLKESSVVRFIPPDESFWVELIKGAAHFISRTPKSFKVKAPYMNAAVEGTEFVIEHTAQMDHAQVIEGMVTLSNAYGEVHLRDLDMSVSRANQSPTSPRKIKVENFSAWVMHYPALFVDLNLKQEIHDSIYTGDFSTALEQLSAVKHAEGADVYSTRAAINLYRGRVDAVREDLTFIRDNLQATPDYFALQAVWALMGLNIDQAKEFAEQALAMDAENPHSLLAYSYILQSEGNVDKAISVMGDATRFSSDLVLRARYAELLLMAGEYKKVKKVVEGFPPKHFLYKKVQVYKAITMLAAHRNRNALEVLTELNDAQSDPLYEFIQGLTNIRLGEEIVGRKHIELAVCLDPSNALYRSYLGNVYATERRLPESETQFNLSKQLDPDSPIPNYYHGMVYQNNLNFLAALPELKQAVEKTGATKTYRSRSLLEGDLAVRQEGLAETYRHLGFNEQAQNLASASLSSKASDFTSHKLLAELYSQSRYRQTASSMERDAAMLVKPLGVFPVSKALSDNVVKSAASIGVTSLGVNEYSSLFMREGLGLKALYLGDFDDNRTADIALNMYGEQFQFSVERYDLENPGYRENSDLSFQLSSVFSQWQITDALSAQVELNNKTIDHGDIYLKFEEESYSPAYRKTSDEDFKRISVKYGRGENALILSAAQREASSTIVDDVYLLDIYLYTQDLIGDEETRQHALAWNYNREFFSSLIGATWLRLEDEFSDRNGGGIQRHEMIKVDEMYFYNYFRLPSPEIVLTLGVELMDIDWKYHAEAVNFDAPNVNELLPKFGIEWHLNSNWMLRYAYGKALTYRSETLNYSLRPTTLAGFDQVFDGTNTKHVVFSGGGIDYTSELFSWGATFMEKDIEMPQLLAFFSDGLALEYALKSKLSNMYFNTSIYKRLSVGLSLSREQYETQSLVDPNSGTSFSRVDAAYDIENRIASLTIGYQLTNNCFLKFVGDSVDQYFLPYWSDEEQENSFQSVDASIEYRTYGGRLTLGLLAKNIFDEDFHIYDLPVHARDFRASYEQYIPKAAYFGYVRYEL